MSDKTNRFLEELKAHPRASVSILAKKHKIATGYAYKLAKKQNAAATAELLGPPAYVVMDTPVNSVQVGGDHYKKNPIQPWDYIVSNDLGYLEGNIVKYVSRWKDKGGRQDLEKARHYLDKLLEVA